MKLIKQASGKKVVKMSRKEWTSIGKKAGWFEERKDKGVSHNEERGTWHAKGGPPDQANDAIELGKLLLTEGYSENTFDQYQSYLRTTLFQIGISGNDPIGDFMSMDNSEIKERCESPYNEGCSFKELLHLKKIVDMVDSSVSAP